VTFYGANRPTGLRITSARRACDPPSQGCWARGGVPASPHARLPHGGGRTRREHLPRRLCVRVVGEAATRGGARRAPRLRESRAHTLEWRRSTCLGHTRTRPTGPFLLEQQDKGGGSYYFWVLMGREHALPPGGTSAWCPCRLDGSGGAQSPHVNQAHQAGRASWPRGSPHPVDALRRVGRVTGVHRPALAPRAT